MDSEAPRVRLRPGLGLADRPPDDLVVSGPAGELVLGGLAAPVRAALHRLAAGDTEDALADAVLASSDPTALAMLYARLDQLRRAVVLCFEFGPRAAPLARVEPMTGRVEVPAAVVAPAEPIQLSRFAFVRRDGSELVLESPRAAVRIVILDDVASLVIGVLAKPRTTAEVRDALDAIRTGAGAAAGVLCALLVVLGFADVVHDGTTVDDVDPGLRLWDFHDLLFHSRTRQGRVDYGYGGTFRFLDVIAPLPAVKAPGAGAVIELEQPDLAAVVAHDPPFGVVLERRRSMRNYATEPVTLAQLSEFLFRVGRLRALIPAAPEQGSYYDVSSRPYPSGGAAYDLEIYVTACRCEGLEPALYHYDPAAHSLQRVRDFTDDVRGLVTDAQRSAALVDEPQVVITLASRFGRLSWKYSAMAYAATLKNVGVLYQTMYLVATAMGLAPCGLGGGDADCFARASGIDYYAEGSVGEFLLGAPAPGEVT